MYMSLGGTGLIKSGGMDERGRQGLNVQEHRIIFMYFQPDLFFSV